MNEWYGNNRTLQTYDENNNRVEYETNTWDSDLSDWKPLQKRVYYWSQIEVTSIYKFNSNLISVFPNPTTDKITVLNCDIIGNTNVKIYSITGELMKNSFCKDIEINTSDLEKGVYILVIQANNKVYSTKFIKQ